MAVLRQWVAREGPANASRGGRRCLVHSSMIIGFFAAGLPARGTGESRAHRRCLIALAAPGMAAASASRVRRKARTDLEGAEAQRVEAQAERSSLSVGSWPSAWR